MSDHYHYGYAYDNHDHNGYASEHHDHGLDYAERHHRHYDDESTAAGLREDLSRAESRIGQLEDDLRDALNRIHTLEDRQPDYADPQAEYEADVAIADAAAAGYGPDVYEDEPDDTAEFKWLP